MNIYFEKVSISHLDIIFGWLAEPFVQEFWDNTQGHKDDILNFVNDRKEPSNYCDGKYVYWIASSNDHPFAMLMTIQETAEDHIDDIKLNHLSKTGNTYGIDYMIGDKSYFGKGYGAKTLSEFIDFFRREFDVAADTFIIDPASDNPRAKHVYMQAGFEHIADFVMSGDCSGAGKSHHLLIRRFVPNVRLLPATVDDYSEITHVSIDVWKQAYKGIIDQDFLDTINFEKWLEGRKKWLKEPNKYAIIALKDTKIIGFCEFGVSSHLEYSKGEIYAIYILPQYQGEGIGTMLLKKAIHRLEEENLIPYIIIALEKNNSARNFYEKLGFHFIGKMLKKIGRSEYSCSIYGSKTLLDGFKIELVTATLADYPIILNMAQYYAVDLAKYLHADVLSIKNNEYFKSYFTEPSRISLLIRNGQEDVGFALINSNGFILSTDFNMGEFFILEKFRKKGIGQQVVDQIWKKYLGRWEVPVIPENIPALTFWRKVIFNFTRGKYLEQIKIVDHDKYQPKRIIFSFNSSHNTCSEKIETGGIV